MVGICTECDYKPVELIHTSTEERFRFAGESPAARKRTRTDRARAGPAVRYRSGMLLVPESRKGHQVREEYPNEPARERSPTAASFRHKK